MDTLLRKAEYRALSKIKLRGSILDLGGSYKSSYRKFWDTGKKIVSLNISAQAKPDIVHNLEKSLPIENESYDNVLLINVLEHIHNYKYLLRESARIIKKKGTLIIAVPFLFPIHPSPVDFWRFSEDILRLEISQAGFSIINIDVLGHGVFSTCFVFIDRLCPYFIRTTINRLLAVVAVFFDEFFSWFAYWTKRKYHKSDYALGYVITAQKINND